MFELHMHASNDVWSKRPRLEVRTCVATASLAGIDTRIIHARHVQGGRIKTQESKLSVEREMKRFPIIHYSTKVSKK